MRKFLATILIGILVLPVSVYAETEYQFDIIFEPDYSVSTYSFDGQNVIAVTNQNGFDKVKVYNQKMEKINEFDKVYESGDGQNIDNEQIESRQRQMKEKYGYECMSEFKNGYSFVRQQEVLSLPIGYNTSISSYLFRESNNENGREKSEKIADESRLGYKFIDEDGNVIYDNIDADVTVYSFRGSTTEPGGGCGVYFTPSYFTEYGTAVIKRDGKFGIINTSGDLLCDFLYDKIIICAPNIAIVEINNRQKFYYINSGLESEFSATKISPLKDNYFNVYENGVTKGVIDFYGNMIMSDVQLFALDGNNVITYEFRSSKAFNAPSRTYYNENFEVVCYEIYNETCDKDGNVIWDNFKINSTLTNLGDFKNNIYVVQSSSPNIYMRALAAINKIPKPTGYVGDKYISIMLNNPLVSVDGVTRTIEEKNYLYTPVVSDERILLPYELLVGLEMWTDWNEIDQTIYVGRGEKTLILKIGSNYADLNDETIHLDVAPQIIDGRVLVPYETIALALGADWDWDTKTKTLTLFYN